MIFSRTLIKKNKIKQNKCLTVMELLGLDCCSAVLKMLLLLDGLWTDAHCTL